MNKDTNSTSNPDSGNLNLNKHSSKNNLDHHNASHQALNTASSKRPFKAVKTWLIAFGVIALVVAGVMLWQTLVAPSEPTVKTVSRDGVISKIQKLNRLETVAYNVDTVITSERTATWQRLWQDGQKGLFIARGRVVAGVDLSKLGQEMIQISDPTLAQIELAKQQAIAGGNEGVISVMPNVMITLPPAEVFNVYLDDIQIYDWQSGLFGMQNAEPKLLAEAQTSAKQEVLERACKNGVMQQAQSNAIEQIRQLFSLAGVEVTVTSQGAGACQLN